MYESYPFVRIQINEPVWFVDGENCTDEDISCFRVIVPYGLIDGICKKIRVQEYGSQVLPMLNGWFRVADRFVSLFPSSTYDVKFRFQLPEPQSVCTVHA